MTITHHFDLNLSPSEQKLVAGEYNAHLKYLQKRLNVSIHQQKDQWILVGFVERVQCATKILHALAHNAKNNIPTSANELHLITQSTLADANFGNNVLSSTAPNTFTNTAPNTSLNPINSTTKTTTQTMANPMTIKSNATDTQTTHTQATEQMPHTKPITLRTRKGNITPRSQTQQHYVQKILTSDISFGVGPAGTGKTYLAVACAVDMLERGEIERILLVRPAVEAGEKLGFLPGDLTQKIDPYLRPLYDALYEMLGFEKVGKLLERQIIEVAPLAYMRGRTLNNSFVILDEAQNTTPEQMKMFLTRLGFGSRAVITGDMSQVDLPRGHKSGLAQAVAILAPIKEIHVTRFLAKDVVRHELVQKIVEAYDSFDAEQEAKKQQKRAEKQHAQSTNPNQDSPAKDGLKNNDTTNPTNNTNNIHITSNNPNGNQPIANYPATDSADKSPSEPSSDKSGDQSSDKPNRPTAATMPLAEF